MMVALVNLMLDCCWVMVFEPEAEESVLLLPETE